MLISGGTPKAKALFWHSTDVEVRKRGDQKGLDTPVVHAVNDDHSINSSISKKPHYLGYHMNLSWNVFIVTFGSWDVCIS